MDVETRKYNSSTIVSSVYNFKERRLTIRFHNGNIYKFDNVALNDYREFDNDTISTGKAFHRVINKRYKGQKVT